MTKTYIIENLGCANCAAKMEAKINALPSVESATLTFATRQLQVTSEDPDALLGQLQQIIGSIESDAYIAPADAHGQGKGCCSHHHDHEEGCCCGHHHNHGEHCACGHCHKQEDHNSPSHEHAHGDEGKPLLFGGVLFALGIGLDLLGATIFGFRLSILAYVAAYLFLGLEIVTKAWKNLIKGHVFDENFLMGIATLGAFFIGEFPEAVGVMLFFRVGEYFEHKAVARSRSQIMEAADLRPETVTRIHGDSEEVIPASEAIPGDLLLVRPGDRIPLDSVVVSGTSRIDTSPVTGEPMPVSAAPGSALLSGCINGEGRLTVKVEKPLSESMVTRILRAVEAAAAGKPKIDRFITRFARVYTPIVVAAAVLTAVIPSLITGDWHYWVYTALSFLVMSCPCALVLSVPLAFFSGIGKGSKKSILFKGGLSIEALAGVKAAALDKTGTVTKGEFRVQQVRGREDLLLLCASLEQSSTHPIAAGIVSAAKEKGLSLLPAQALEEYSGLGLRGQVGGYELLCGNARLMEKFGISLPEVPPQGNTLVLAAVDGSYAGFLELGDTLKEDARKAVEQLEAMGIQTAMLTGDREESAKAAAQKAGFSRVFARLLPEDKLTVLQTLRKELGPVLFVGDGINDAPVLSGADVGAAMGSGADAAIEAADVVYMTSQVSAIPESIVLARRIRAVAWQNVVFALGVKAVVMLLGLLGHASMWLAVFADSGVALLCVLNSIRLLFGKKGT